MFACCNPRLKKNRHTYTRPWNVYIWRLLLLQNQLCYLNSECSFSPELRDGLLQSGPMWSDSHLGEQGCQGVRWLQGWYLSILGTGAVRDTLMSNVQIQCHTENKIGITCGQSQRKKQVSSLCGRTYSCYKLISKQGWARENSFAYGGTSQPKDLTLSYSSLCCGDRSNTTFLICYVIVVILLLL